MAAPEDPVATPDVSYYYYYSLSFLFIESLLLATESTNLLTLILSVGTPSWLSSFPSVTCLARVDVPPGVLSPAAVWVSLSTRDKALRPRGVDIPAGVLDGVFS